MAKESGPKEKALRAARERAYAERLLARGQNVKGQVEPEKAVQPKVRPRKKSGGSEA